MTAPTLFVLPLYKCHKHVRAARIIAVDFNVPDHFGADLLVETPDKQRHKISVSPEYVAKHAPFVGGYYVVYEDGYASFSPATAFESGYRLEQADREEEATLRQASLDLGNELA